LRPAYLLTAALLLIAIGCGAADTSTPRKSPSPATQDAGGDPSTTQAAHDRPSEERLLGTWVAQDVDSKIGQVTIKLTFRKAGDMKLAAWSDIPFVGQVRDKQGPYEVRGDVISASAIRGGTSVQFRFDGDILVIQYKDGKTVRFSRA